MPLLTIQIVTWNSAGVLEPGLKALAAIPKNEVIVRIIDNASTDNTLHLIKTILPQADIIELSENKGFAQGHNIGFSKCTTQFVMAHDPDVKVEWLGLKKLLEVFADSNVAAVQGKMLRREKTPDGQPCIDTAGIILSKALNGIERGSYEEDRGQYEQPAELIAVTGAGGIYRLSALQQVSHVNPKNIPEVFDRDFFAYKEDVDLGWRLKRAGWKSMYVPVLMGYHNRSLGRRGVMNWGLNIKTIYARLKSPRTRYSLRNWIWMIAKNVTLKQELKAELFIDARLLTFFVFTIMYPPLFKVWGETLRGLPRMLEKRRILR